jgi:regulator of protease activity HflC (stomatin/prohibitin superfamily)
MKKKFLLLAGLAVTLMMQSCGYERINAGHVGIKVNLYGDEKGVDNVVEVTGAQWYNPIKTEIYETPTFVQNSVWTEDEREESDKREGFTLTTQDGMTVGIDVSLNYRVLPQNAVEIFKKYRKPLEEVSNTVLRNYTRDGFNTAASMFTAEEMYSDRAAFEDVADSLVTQILEKEGFTVEKIVLLNAIRLPESVTKSIEAKVKAKQIALQKQQELAQAEADAEKAIEDARGRAESMKIKADAERYAYEQKQRSLTPLLVQQQWVEKWNGNLGTGNVYGVGTIPYKNISK